MSFYQQQMKKYGNIDGIQTIQQYKKFVETYPAYNFIVYYSNIMMTVSEGNPESDFIKKLAHTLKMESDRDINTELRLVELESDLVPLVERTRNNIFFRPLFFHSLFINNDFHFEDIIIKGIYVTECHTKKGSSNYILHHPDVNDYAIFVIAADVNVGCEFCLNIALVDETIGEQQLDSKEERLKLKRCASFVRTMICNIIDMVENNDNLSVVTIETTKEQNLKRIKRKQIPMPTKVFIRAKDEFKKYVNKFNSDAKAAKRKVGYMFEVMGHYRHFRDEKFKKVKGTKRWIYPYYKGEGIMIAKDYFIKK